MEGGCAIGRPLLCSARGRRKACYIIIKICVGGGYIFRYLPSELHALRKDMSLVQADAFVP